MHAQIRTVIGSLRFTTGSVSIDLSAGERTPLGNIISRVYYETNIGDVVDRAYRSGYPHNGGQHTFHFQGPRGEAVAMLELIKETMLERFKLNEETRQVANELSFVSQEIIGHRPK